MKRKIALLFVTLATALPAALHADTVESNVAISLKYYFNFNPPTLNNSSNVRTVKHSTVTIKNADIIAAINEANGTDYKINSRILRRDQFTPEGTRVGTPVYFLRDRVIGDVNITEYLEVVRSANAYNEKFSTTKKTGTMSIISETLVRFTAFPETPFESDIITLRGLDRQTTRYVVNARTKNFIELIALKVNLAGNRYFAIPSQGYVDAPTEGTLKISGAKAVKQAL